MEKLEHFVIRSEVITVFHPICVTNVYQSTLGLAFQKDKTIWGVPQRSVLGPLMTIMIVKIHQENETFFLKSK